MKLPKHLLFMDNSAQLPAFDVAEFAGVAVGSNPRSLASF
jgi:hypothetical protein